MLLGLEVFPVDVGAESRTWTAQTDGSLALTGVSQSVYASAKDKLCTDSDKCSHIIACAGDGEIHADGGATRLLLSRVLVCWCRSRAFALVLLSFWLGLRGKGFC
jgi:hypothetical protein